MNSDIFNNPRFRLLLDQTSSKNFLCQPLPGNWNELSRPEQDSFLLDNAWEPLGHLTADKIRETINDCSSVFILLLTKLTEDPSLTPGLCDRWVEVQGDRQTKNTNILGKKTND